MANVMAFDESLLEGLTYRTDEDADTDERLRELILYLADRCSGDDTFGVTRLNKNLMYADFVSFFRRQKAITGAEYMRQRYGPVPRRVKWILTRMQEDGDLVVRKVSVGKHTRHKLIPTRKAKPIFTQEDLEIVDKIVQTFSGHTAKAVSDFSHGIAWRIAGTDGVGIPYEAIFLSDEEPDAYDIARAKELNQKFQWEPTSA